MSLEADASVEVIEVGDALSDGFKIRRGPGLASDWNTEGWQDLVSLLILTIS
jgi:hypothetical protein